MKDDYNSGIYEAQEYHPGGYPQLRKKRTCLAVTHRSQEKSPVNMMWGLMLFGLASVCLVCLTMFWLAC